MHVCICIYIYTYLCVYIYIYTYIYEHLQIYVYIYIRICIHIPIHIHVHMYIYKSTPNTPSLKSVSSQISSKSARWSLYVVNLSVGWLQIKKKIARPTVAPIIRIREKFSKTSLIVTLRSKFNSGLTFENLWIVGHIYTNTHTHITTHIHTHTFTPNVRVRRHQAMCVTRRIFFDRTQTMCGG